jgi:hypothetical protein
MSKKIFSLSIFTIALAMAFVFSAPIVTRAASDNYNDPFTGITNLVGIDEATSNVSSFHDRDRDNARDSKFPSYGLQGNWAGQH